MSGRSHNRKVLQFLKDLAVVTAATHCLPDGVKPGETAGETPDLPTPSDRNEWPQSQPQGPSILEGPCGCDCGHSLSAGRCQTRRDSGRDSRSPHTFRSE